MTSFPFDVQRCHFKIKSSGYNTNEMEMIFFKTTSNIDISHVHENAEWYIQNHWAAQRDVAFSQDTLTFYIFLTRRSEFYFSLLLLPTIALSLIHPYQFMLPTADRTTLSMFNSVKFSFLTSIYFVSSLTSNELICFSDVGLFTACLFLLLILTQLVPPSSFTMPWLGKTDNSLSLPKFCQNCDLLLGRKLPLSCCRISLHLANSAGSNGCVSARVPWRNRSLCPQSACAHERRKCSSPVAVKPGLYSDLHVLIHFMSNASFCSASHAKVKQVFTTMRRNRSRRSVRCRLTLMQTLQLIQKQHLKILLNQQMEKSTGKACTKEKFSQSQLIQLRHQTIQQRLNQPKRKTIAEWKQSGLTESVRFCFWHCLRHLCIFSFQTQNEGT